MSKRYVVYARLDHALANHLCLTIYPNAMLTNFPIFGSNYGPIFLNLPIAIPMKNDPKFRFEAKWLLNNDVLTLSKILLGVCMLITYY